MDVGPPARSWLLLAHALGARSAPSMSGPGLAGWLGRCPRVIAAVKCSFGDVMVAALGGGLRGRLSSERCCGGGVFSSLVVRMARSEIEGDPGGGVPQM